jgi:hypothetical protein
MAYPITTTSGITLASVPNGTVNNTTTSLTLIGKNYAGYGNFLNENFLYLLENFSNSIAPANALKGQLWYDSGTLVLKVYDGTQWKPISSSTVAGNAPSSGVVGDLWWNNNTQQLNVYNGQGWTIIGPAFSAEGGTTGPEVRTIIDTSGNANNVIVFLVEDDIIGIMSKDPTFTPRTSIAGFSTINPGFNLISPSAISGSQFTGDASNALGLNGVTATPYLRNDQDTQTTGVLTAGGGLRVGSDLVIDTSSITETSIRSLTRNLNFYVNGTGNIAAIGINGSTGSISVNGGSAATAIINSGTNGTGNIGTSAQRFNTVFARATSAQYADLAENYLGDTDYEVGTVVIFGGEKEITTTQLIADTAVAGVISTNPAYLMNSSLESGQPVALRGRVPVKVTGTVKKGDLLVTSDIAGTAVSVGRDNSHGHAVFAKSLEDKTTNEVQLIEAVII